LTDERWQRVKALFQAAVERPAEERDAFLASAAGDDDELRREVESLLTSDAAGVSFLDRLPVASEALRADPLIVLPASMGQTPAQTVLPSGHRVGAYEVVAPLGAGGMGEVYKARDTRLDRIVAIKVLPAHVARDSLARDRFEREARAVAALNHPHICTLFDVGEAPIPASGSPQPSAISPDLVRFLVMEHLDGETLSARLARGPLPLDRAMVIAVQIASALDTAHRAGIVHRDLKPGNVMLTKTGAKLLDFGLAKATGAMLGRDPTRAPSALDLTIPGTILGTVQYMAPEQIEGKEADARSAPCSTKWSPAAKPSKVRAKRA
jgi:eukaryotic-like serine/threonine-protein kinase